MEPSLPGACESIVSTCGFWNKDALCGERDTLAALFSQCDSHHKQAKRFLSCAGAFIQAVREQIENRLDDAKLRAAAAALVRRYCPGKGGGRGERTRLLTAVTPRGLLSQNDTLDALECECIPIEDRYSVASGILLGYVRDLLLGAGYGIITCPDPVTGLTETVIVPECSTAFRASRSPVTSEGQRVTHCDRFIAEPLSREDKRRLTENLRRADDMVSLACDRLAMALATHDALEAVYIAASDFSGMDTLAASVCEEFFGSSRKLGGF